MPDHTQRRSYTNVHLAYVKTEKVSKICLTITDTWKYTRVNTSNAW